MEEDRKPSPELIRELNELRRQLRRLEKSEEERKVFDDILRESEHRFRSIFESAMDGILLADMESRMFFFGNNMICRMLGYDPDEIRELRVMDIHPKQDLPYVIEQFEKQSRKEISLARDIPVQRKDGSVFYADINSTPVTIAGKQYLLGIFRDITEYKRAKEALEESERQYRLLAENVTDVIWILDLAQQKFTYVSPSIERMTGHRAEEILSRPLHEFLTEDSFRKISESLEEQIELEQSGAADPDRLWSLEIRPVTRDGSEIWNEAIMTFLRDDSGRPYGILGVSRNITRRKQAETALRESEERFRALIENASDAFAVMDASSQVIYGSPSVGKILGYEPHEISGIKILDLIHPDDLPASLDILRESLPRPGATAKVKYRFRHRDGSWRWVEGMGKNMLHDPMVNGIILNYHDVTDRQLAEEQLRKAHDDLERRVEERTAELKRANEAIRISEEMYKTLVRTSPGAVIVTAMDGSIIEVSEQTLELFGFPDTGEILGKKGFDLLAPEERPRAAENLKRFLREGSAERNIDYTYRNSDGTRFVGETNVSLITNSRGEPKAIMSTVGDVTERKRAEQALQESEEKWRQLAQNIPDFLMAITRDGTITAINHTVTGISLEEPIGKPIYEYIDPDYHELIRPVIERVFLTGNTDSYRVLGTGAKGPKTAWYETRVVPIILDGQITGVTLISTDVTERKLAEDAIRESEEKFAKAFQTNPSLMAIVTLDESRYIEVNERFLEVLGYERNDVIGKTPQELGIFTETDFFIAAGQKIQETGHLRNLEGTLRTKQGTLLHGLFSADLIHIQDKPYVLTVVNDITDRKLAEEALRKSEERFRRMADNIEDGLTIIEHGKVVYVNDRMCEITGYDKNDLKKLTAFDLAAPEEKERLQRVIREQRRSGILAEELEFWIVRKDGSRRCILNRYSFSRNHYQTVGRYIVTTDITERKLAEQALRDSEEMYKTLLRTSPDAIVVIDLQGNFIEASGRAFELFREDDIEEWRARNAIDYIAREDRERAARYLRNITSVGFGRIEEWTMLRKDGARFIAELNASRLTDAEGNPRAIIVVLRDITDRKLAEESLQESEEMYKALVQTSPDAVTVVDLEGNVIEVSQRMLEMYGFDTAEEILGKSGLTLLAPENYGYGLENQAAFITGGRTTRKREYVLLKKDRSRFIGEVNAAFIRDAAGNPKAIITTTRDITERKELEKELVETTAREQRRIGQDLHDGLGQHLTGIAFLSRALERGLEEKGFPESSQAGKIVQLVNQAITQTRSLARGLCPVGMDAHGLRSALREMAANVEDVFGISCTFECDDTILIDDNTISTHLYQIALEAVNNAIRHGNSSEIVVRLAPADNNVVLTVEDNGRGVSEEKTRTRGMGLHLMNYRANLINGSLNVQRSNGGGTIVTCSFPWWEEKPAKRKKLWRRK